MRDVKPVLGYEGLYSVRADGRVWSHYKHIWLSPGLSTDGYLLVVLRKGGEKKSIKVHRIVALAFAGPPPKPKMDVNHKNGVKTDNRAENLEWMTRKENCKHAIDTGLWVPDRTNAKRIGIAARKLTVDQALAIVSAYQSGQLQKHLAVEYGISTSTVNNICKGRRYVATI